MNRTSDVSVADARRHFADLLDRAALGEHVAITRRGTHVATLGPAERTRRSGAGDALRAIIRDLDGEGLTDEELADLRPSFSSAPIHDR